MRESERLARQIFEAAQTRSGQLEDFVHREATMQPVTAPERRLQGPSAIASYLRDEMDAQTLQGVGIDAIEALDDAHAVVTGRLALRLSGGGFQVIRAVWAMTFDDGLLWRCQPALNRDEAATLLKGIQPSLAALPDALTLAPPFAVCRAPKESRDLGQPA